ncbi:threonine/homoserine/homoserine lactone efflux protein [Haladaptatus paucihalophilus DX253]|uniref:Threonine/homoserine/homoserine lactone efflux protein n=1 Tax=Haladaptatus paucihalophilus DX253 TaxID=797209 RepID=E7QX81_HALPU|nr:LysE family translocator [Haladaptatus paucihalophilus]EFW90884.1 threonine/homoserine/homoserine lactone efflux protein [Haladaptatus paucihalophilus DX253]SHK24932.1 Threonine/homoserine/homoserine lactone efflux protein [Haladaptatus paucihalophilus DX253]
MVDTGVLVAFVPAALALNVAPGPDSIYTLKRSISDGRTAGVMAAAGTSTGSLVHTTAAVLGLSALLKASALAFTAVKLVGAAYLLYLGVTTFRNRDEFDIASDGETQSHAESFRQAFVINVSNPKVAVFFLAFLPQFVESSGNAPVQIFTLGVLFGCLGFCYQAALATFSSRARRVILERAVVRDLLRYASASVLVGFGVELLFEKRVVN